MGGWPKTGEPLELKRFRGTPGGTRTPNLLIRRTIRNPRSPLGHHSRHPAFGLDVLRVAGYGRIRRQCSRFRREASVDLNQDTTQKSIKP